MLHIGRKAAPRRAVAGSSSWTTTEARSLQQCAPRRLPVAGPPATHCRSFASKPPPPPPSSSSKPPSSSSSPSSPNSSLPNDGRSFRGQVLESISSRMAREKTQREQMAQQRQNSQGARNLATTFMLTFVGVACYFFGLKTPRDPEPDSTLPLENTRAPTHKTSRSDLEAAWADFVAIVGEENVSTKEHDIAAHSSSDWSSHQDEVEPGSSKTKSGKPLAFCVIYPSSTDEVSRILKVCHRRRIPITGFSGGTSLEGHFAPTRGGVIIDFAHRMDHVLEVHKEDLDAVVQPGVGWEVLNEQLAQQGLFFPPDPGPGAQIGGMIGTGCSGMNAYRYGTMREWVLSLTVVLADGTVIKTRQRPRKSSAGYDLTKLFIGSEGTLGLVTEATLKLAVAPTDTNVALASFDSIRAAARCASEVVGEGLPVAAIELLDDAQMKCINDAGTTSRAWAERATLLFKFAGNAPRVVRDQIDAVKAVATATKGNLSFEFARSSAEQAELWSARKQALWSSIATKKPGERVWTGDVAVPISQLPGIIEEVKEDLKQSGLHGTIVGHVGDGNFHTILLYDDTNRPVAEEFVHRMVKRAIELEGTVTGEHGVGLVKRDYLPHELGEDTIAAMRKIKAAFDPLCLLNCDKVVRMQKPKPGEIAPW